MCEWEGVDIAEQQWLVKFPRLAQLQSFIRSYESTLDVNRIAGFKAMFEFPDEEYELMLQQGMMNPNEELDIMASQLSSVVNLDVETQIQSNLNGLYNQIPVMTPLSFGVFLLDRGRHTDFVRTHMFGIKAFVGTDGVMRVIVSPTANFTEKLKPIIAHEYNHHLRIGACKLTDDNMKLLDVLIMEGLAEHFVQNLFGSKCVGHWANALNHDGAISLFRSKYVPYLNQSVLETQQFIFGSSSEGIPLWAGYSIGFHLVKESC